MKQIQFFVEFVTFIVPKPTDYFKTAISKTVGLFLVVITRKICFLRCIYK